MTVTWQPIATLLGQCTRPGHVPAAEPGLFQDSNENFAVDYLSNNDKVRLHRNASRSIEN